MKTKFIFIALALLVAVGTAQGYIPTIEADTIFKGFDSGIVSGIVFANDGKSVIIIHDGQPVEIDVETRKIVREFEKVPNATSSATKLEYINLNKYLITTIKASELNGNKYFDGTIVWDYNTGKIVKTLQKMYFITNGEHNYIWNGVDGFLYDYDLSNFRKVDSIKLKSFNSYPEKTTWQHPVILPNTNKILFNVYLDRPDNYGGREFQGIQLYVVDFKTQEYKNIKFPDGKQQVYALIFKIATTETGKYYIIEKKQCQFMIYDSNLNFLYEIKYEDWPNLAGLEVAYAPMFINSFNDDHLIFEVNLNSNYYTDFKTICLNISEKKIYKYLALTGIHFDWEDNCFAKYDRLTNKLSLVNKSGLVGLFDAEITPVQEPRKTLSLEITYRNNQIEYFSDKTFLGETQILNLAGKVVCNLGVLEYTIGKNAIHSDLPLPNGIYIFLVKAESGNTSYKFMISR